MRVVAGDLAFEDSDHHRLADLEAAGGANATALAAFGSAQLISDRVQGTASQLFEHNNAAP
jgi:transcriptional regulator of nitric oxide reductase